MAKKKKKKRETKKRGKTRPVLTPMQQAFVNARLTGMKGTEAAIAAGYKTPSVAGSRLLRHANIRAALKKRVDELPGVAGAKEMQEFWSTTLRDVVVDYKHRLAASQHLAKSQGLFLDVKVKVPYEDLSDEELLARGMDVLNRLRGA